MAPRTDFPPVRACLFDMDGLLLDTEDLYSLCINMVLERYGRPSLPWSIKAKLQGRPAVEGNKIFHDWARLPIGYDQYLAEFTALQRAHFPSARPLPGVARLLADLGRTRYWDLAPPPQAAAAAGRRVHLALATSSTEVNFRLKSAHLPELFAVFPAARRVVGDDARVVPGRGKPNPDIYLLALRTINDGLPPGEPPVAPDECLVFEDSVLGVESGRRAGMRVVWCPHPLLRREYAGRDAEILAARTGEGGTADLHQLGEVGDGWGEYLETLEDFPYERYGIVVPPVEVDDEPAMKASAEVGEVQVVEAKAAL